MSNPFDLLTEASNAKLADEIRGLLENVSDAEFREIGIEALRRWRRRTAAPQSTQQPLMREPNTVFALNGIGIELAQLLADRKGVQPSKVHALKEVFCWDAALRRDWMSPVAEFIWWLVRAGLAVEYAYNYLGPPSQQYPVQAVFPVSLRLTARGVRLVDSTADDDPLLPGFLDRIQQRCLGIPDGVLALLVDARECLDRCLMRPAVILMGVAYELAIEDVIGRLITKGLVAKSTLDLEAKKRLDRVLEMIKDDGKLSLVVSGADDKRRVQMAYDFADKLRLERNSAAHTRPAFDYEHREETEEFLVSAGRHLPGIWLLARD
jgi:hypothetical protein